MITLAVQSGNLNFLEGCLHAYTPYNQSFPGTMLSTGTEVGTDSLCACNTPLTRWCGWCSCGRTTLTPRGRFKNLLLPTHVMCC